MIGRRREGIWKTQRTPLRLPTKIGLNKCSEIAVVACLERGFEEVKLGRSTPEEDLVEHRFVRAVRGGYWS